MTTFDLSNIEKVGVKFIRDVFRQNISDPSNNNRSGNEWIFKSMPRNRNFNKPFIIIDSGKTKNKNIMGNNSKGAVLNLSIEVWAKKPGVRDQLSDKITSLLRDNTSSDTDGDALGDNELFYGSIDTDTDDMEDMDGNTIRIKYIDVNLNYGGS